MPKRRLLNVMKFLKTSFECYEILKDAFCICGNAFFGNLNVLYKIIFKKNTKKRDKVRIPKKKVFQKEFTESLLLYCELY